MKAYTDGACCGNPGPGGWAVQLHHPDGLVEERGGSVPEVTTNNRMELLAVIRAMELIWQTLGEPEVVKAARPLILTDSEYVVNGVNRWLRTWRKRNFHKADGSPVANRDLWEQILELSPEFFRFKWLKGHNGDRNQERVDRLAVALSKRKPVSFFYGFPDVGAARTGRYPCYLALVDGKLSRHLDWPSCEAAVSGKSRALCRKVWSRFEEVQVLKEWGFE